MKRHLKRLALPRSITIARKTEVFIARPHPGKHKLGQGIALVNFIRDMLHFASTAKEVKAILNAGDCLVDGKQIKNTNYNVGIFDVISFPKIKQSYRMTVTQKGKLHFTLLDEKEASLKVCKIIGKKTLPKGKIQLNLSDSRNILVPKDTYKVGDSILIQIPDQKIVEHFKLEKGNTIFLLGGKHIGESGEIVNIHNQEIVYKNTAGDTVETRAYYAYVVGTKKSAITLNTK